MKSPVALSAACLAVLTVLAAHAAPALPASDIGAPHAIAAPFYGDTLFDFYQDKTFDALTDLMVSQHFGRIAPHDDEAEVLRGGMLLAWGQNREAEALFLRLIERQTAPAVRDRAWFFLARSQHQRGLEAQAEATLARIAAPLPGPLEAEHQLLLAQLMMERGDHVGAAALLDTLEARASDLHLSPAAAAYARYNLGVALIKSADPKQVKRGQEQLDAIGKMPGPDEEMRGLRDRANVALGFVDLQAGDAIGARAVLQRVRLEGAASDKALLGFGWAALQLHDPQLALTPWTELAERSGHEPAMLEARLAVPYAKGELGAYGGALAGYRQAVAGFAQEQQALDESIAAIRAGALVDGLMSLNPGTGRSGLGRLADIRALPEMPHAAHLVPILAGNEFQQGFRNLRDLDFLAGNLTQWQQSLTSFEDMLATRRAAFAERVPAVRAQAGRADLAAQRQRLAALQSEFDQAVADEDDSVFASTPERALQARIGHAQGLVTALRDAAPADAAAAVPVPVPTDAAERLRRVQGALAWTRVQALPAREWEVRKGLRAAKVALAQAQQRDADLARAQQAEPARNAAFEVRIAALSQRITALQPQVAALAGEQRAELQAIAVAELQREQERLGGYSAQAQLAIAQILDRAQLARHEDAKPAGGAQ